MKFQLTSYLVLTNNEVDPKIRGKALLWSADPLVVERWK